MEIPDHEKGNPDTVAAEIGVQGGIEALPKRIDRYAKAKKTALDIANSIVDHAESNPGGKADALLKRADRLATCGDYLVFAHYYTRDEVRLHGARLCMQHLLCPLCAIRRGAKALKSYLDRWECIKAEKPLLRPFMVTLTVKDGPDLEERFKHLQSPNMSCGIANVEAVVHRSMVSLVQSGRMSSNRAKTLACGIHTCT